jgi:HAMP domain-containing protein/signal transduction histidine kinase/ActR/RegA family two-component response regulator
MAILPNVTPFIAMLLGCGLLPSFKKSVQLFSSEKNWITLPQGVSSVETNTPASLPQTKKKRAKLKTAPKENRIPARSLKPDGFVREAKATDEPNLEGRREIDALVEVLMAMKNGDFSVRLPYARGGMLAQAGELLNDIIGLNEHMASELVRVGKIVGQEGRMTERASVGPARGEWAQSMNSVNQLISDLVAPTNEVGRVITAVARGDLSQKISLEIEGRPVRGEFLRIGTTVNGMVDQLNSFASEVTRVAKEVGNEGKLGGQAEVKGVSGTWKDLTENVNGLAANLTNQVRNIAKVTTAVAKGDLSQTITVDAKGEIAELKNTINTMVDQLSSFASEVTRVAKEVGNEGKLGGQADVRGVSGTWKDLTDNVNVLAANLTGQVRNIAKVTTAVANGDLSQKITVDAKGEVNELKGTINTMVDTLRSFAAEVTRVAKEVGTEGKLGGQADVKGVSGTWKDLTDNVNTMASNLTVQLRDVSKVATAIANGDLNQKITVDVKGEILQIKDVINKMVDQLNSFASEVTRVAKEVGNEGRLGGQAEVRGVSGTWKDLTDNVNGLAGNLTAQVRNIANVTTAVANGDLSQKITVEAKGEIAELKNTINTMVDQLRSFAAEVTRVAKEVGTEGKLGGQADVRGVSGTWKDLTDNVNVLAANLTTQVRNIAKVTTAVAKGDLGQKITVEARGEIAELKNTINTMVDQLSSFAAEVTRVAKEVGTEGKLGGTAEVKGVSGTWKDLTDNVNTMATNLTVQLRDVSKVATAIANGDLSQKITVDVKGEILQIKDVFNKMVDQLNSFASEVTRVAKEVGTEGKLGGQAEVRGVSGTWKDLTDNVNFMASNLTMQVRGIVKVVTAIANGDLNQKFVLEAKGEVAALAETINNMTDTLRLFADQVTSVAREVGIEGKLGGHAKVPGVAGTWKDLTDNVNFMASNLTTQVRGIVKVVTAVANGDLNQKFVLEAKGEVAALAETINSMTDTLRIFADQVTTVAREVGIEGKLGGQAKVPGAAGTWRELTDNVNQLAGNLTSQVRAIADVSTAVTKGDLTRSINVEAQGELLQLKDNVNQMISNLKDTTNKNQEQDWLKTNLAKFSGMMQGQRNIVSVAQLMMSELTPLVDAQHGGFFFMENERDFTEASLNLIASYGFSVRKSMATSYRLKESLVGQCAFEKKRILLSNVPEGFITVQTGLGEAPPRNVVVLPVLFEGETKAVIELASFKEFSENQLIFLDQLMDSLGVILNMISSTMRTEELLQELKRSNAELEGKADELNEKARLLEVKNQEVELASRSVEEKAEQLQLISKYKSEFLANMSHELRTPLNSLLILSKMLFENRSGNLTQEQVKFAKTVFESGNDLLGLINEILDLSKVEAGKMPIDPKPVKVGELRDYVEQTFRHVADQKNLGFEIKLSRDVPAEMFTDASRLNQILKNLLSNAFKFTAKGKVDLSIERGRNDKSGNLMVAFAVKDTGIGIPSEKQNLIFEAFQQADGTTSRKYGGTGLGLTISREISRLLGGWIEVESSSGEGSTFTLFLPEKYTGPEANRSVVELRTEECERDTNTGIPPLPEGIDFEGTKVLVMDDDIRNIFAINSILESRNITVLHAENGREGIELLLENPDVDVVLMDTMMPEMDGLSATAEIRKIPQFLALPIISLTAKAMKGDREKALEAGASDYVTKPVDPDRLLSVIHCWKERNLNEH